MAILPVTSKRVAPRLTGPIWAVDNPECYKKSKDPRCESEPNAELLLQRIIERKEERKRRIIQKAEAAAEMVALEDELPDQEDESEDEYKMDYEDEYQDTHFYVDSRIRVKLEYMTTLELNTTTITNYLKPFKSQLATLSNLVEFPQLAAYLLATSTKKPVDADSSSDESILLIDDSLPPNQRRRRAVLNGKVFNYPLNEQQASILDRFRHAETLVFTSLPSPDCIMKLIALSVQVTMPYYNQVLFPNAKKVVFSSTMQEKSLVDRYSLLGSRITPHPITFALDWLVGDFSLCIHSTTCATRDQWVANRVRLDETDSTEDDLREIYRKKWSTLNPLSGNVSIKDLPRLRSISYHNILPGDRPNFAGNIETYLYFGPHQDPIIKDVNVTHKHIAKTLFPPYNLPQTLPPGKLHLINVEYLGYATPRKPGPKAISEGMIRREESLGRLMGHVSKIYNAQGRQLEGKATRRLLAQLEAGANENLCDSLCVTCEGMCEELSCNQFEIDDFDD